MAAASGRSDAINSHNSLQIEFIDYRSSMKLEDDLKTVPWKQTCPLRMLWTQWSTYSLTTSWTLILKKAKTKWRMKR